MEIHRSKLKNAPYNPRVLTDAQRRKLQAGLKEHGLVSPITWNIRTGNLVGGHQRLKSLDALAGTQDYYLHVAQIDVPESQEKELNILLNNPEAMGEWDLDKLTDMFKDQSVRLDKTGFDHADLFKLLGDSPFTERAHDSEVLIEKLESVRGAYDRAMDTKETDSARERRNLHSQNFYCVLVFKNEDDCNAFCEEYGLPTDYRFQSGEDLKAAIAKKLGQEEE